MPVDASIYAQQRPFRLDDPLDQVAKVAALRQAQRQFTLEDDLSQIGRETGGDLGKMSAALLQRGHVAPAIQLSASATAQDKAKADLFKKNLETMRDIIAQASGDADMPIVRNAAAQLFGPEGAARIPERFTPEWQRGRLMDAAARLKALTPEIKMTDIGGSVVPTNVNPLAGNVGPFANAQPIVKTAPPAGPTELARLQAERAAMKPGDPRIPQHDRVIASYKAGHGTDVTVNTGEMAPGKAAATKIDEALLDTGNRLMRLNQIETLYRPEFQEIGTKITNKYTSLKAMAGVKLTNKETKDLQDFSAYRRNALENLNEYIRSVTGAVVNETEVPRLMGAMPNPGQGLFDGDDPVTFEAKKNDVIKMLKMGEARLAYMKRNGMSLDDGRGNAVVPLDAMPQLINARGAEIEARLRQQQPNAEKKALDKAVRRQLAVEFGLSSD